MITIVVTDGVIATSCPARLGCELNHSLLSLLVDASSSLEAVAFAVARSGSTISTVAITLPGMTLMLMLDADGNCASIEARRPSTGKVSTVRPAKVS